MPFRKVLVALGLLLAGGTMPNALIAQGCSEESVVIEFDHRNSTLKPFPKCVHDGTVVSVKIDNVNPFLYEVVIEGATVTRHVEVPTIFSSALTPPTTMNTVAPESGSAAATTDTTGVGLLPPPDARNGPFTDAFDDHGKALSNAYSLASLEALVVDLMYSDSRTEASMKEEASRILQEGFSRTTPEGVVAGGHEALQAVDAAYIRLHEAAAAFGSSRPSWVTGAVNRATKAHGDFDKARDALSKAYVNTASVFAQIQSASFTVAGGATVSKGDEVRITVEVKRRGSVPAAYTTDRIRPDGPLVMLEVTGGVRVDFSGGLLVSGLTDQKYSTQGDPAAVAREQQGENSSSVAVGSLAHIYPKWNHRVYPALSFGLGVRDASTLTYFAGGSIIFGNSRRWVLSFGWAFGETQTLGAGLAENAPFEGNGPIPMESQVTDSVFLGFTFNFGS